jgi:hypothetical protein
MVGRGGKEGPLSGPCRVLLGFVLGLVNQHILLLGLSGRRQILAFHRGNFRAGARVLVLTGFGGYLARAVPFLTRHNILLRIAVEAECGGWSGPEVLPPRPSL